MIIYSDYALLSYLQVLYQPPAVQDVVWDLLADLLLELPVQHAGGGEVTLTSLLMFFFLLTFKRRLASIPHHRDGSENAPVVRFAPHFLSFVDGETEAGFVPTSQRWIRGCLFCVEVVLCYLEIK